MISMRLLMTLRVAFPKLGREMPSSAPERNCRLVAPVFSGEVSAGHPRIAMLKTPDGWQFANRLEWKTWPWCLGSSGTWCKRYKDGRMCSSGQTAISLQASRHRHRL
ncbi:hypothetical protein IG631_14086 [Alternaria alternata]|nr:hypothetical protein IG631_14086 [Alternaria alternata]